MKLVVLWSFPSLIWTLCSSLSLSPHQSSQHSKASESSTKPAGSNKDPDQPCFTKKEVRDIIFERNELKTNLFLVQEELNYYQRWVLEKKTQQRIKWRNAFNETFADH